MFSGIWKWFYLGVCFNKMVKFKFNFLLFFFIINSGSYISKAQKLFIPISDQEIISIYKTGEKKNDGSYESKDKNGNVRIKGKFNKLIPVGKWFILFEDGKLMSTYSYSDQGKLDGVFVEYFSNGKIKTTGEFENNIQTGIWKSFYMNGNIETEGFLLEGRRYKQWNYYFESGRIKEISNYNYEGKLDGELISFDQFGTIVSKSSYKENKIHGEYLEFYFNGNLALSGYYEMGFKDSVWLEFTMFKRKSFEKRYKNNLPHSRWVYYYPNSNYIQKEEYYNNGLKDGLFKEFYFGGRISKSSI